MNEHDDVICQVRDSFAGLRMDLPVEQVFAASRPDPDPRRNGPGGGPGAFRPPAVTGPGSGHARRVLGDQRPRRQHHADHLQG